MLKDFEVKTIRILANGFSIQQASKKLFVSVPAIKKRIQTINEKLGTHNMASMIATSAGLGIV
jgi:DNA-binding NarL/FixJ family response regulator